MYFYIGILTASLMSLANADPVLMPPVELSYDSPYGPNVTIDEERGGKADVATALTDLGGKLIIDDNKGTMVHFWEYKGNYIIESECWEDGSGPCANGNCLDNNGRRGMKIQEISIKCAFFCLHRTHCRLQTCCPFTNERPHTAWRQKSNADCWKKCGKKGGSCPNFCGNNAYCCRKGFGGCPAGAAEVSPSYHRCVQNTVGGNGEEVCEGHGYNETACTAIGCCHFNDGQCWSSVGDGPCGASGNTSGGDGLCPEGYKAISQNLDGVGKAWAQPHPLATRTKAECAAICNARSGCTAFEFAEGATEHGACGTYTGGDANIQGDEKRLEANSNWRSCVRKPS